MIIDVHAHLRENECADGNRDMLLAVMEKYNITKIYISRLRMSSEADKWHASQTPDEVSAVNNDVASFVRESAGRVGGYAFINPNNNNSVDELKRCIEEKDLEGIKLWVDVYCDDYKVNPLMEKAIDYGIPVLIHAFHKATKQYPNETTAVHVARLAKRYPEAKIILAHLGGNAYHAIPLIREQPNVWVDHSGSMFRGDELSYTVSEIGAGRVLYGTDLPGCSHLINLGQTLELDISEEELNLIHYKNANKVFNRGYKVVG